MKKLKIIKTTILSLFAPTLITTAVLGTEIFNNQKSTEQFQNVNLLNSSTFEKPYEELSSTTFQIDDSIPAVPKLTDHVGTDNQNNLFTLTYDGNGLYVYVLENGSWVKKNAVEANYRINATGQIWSVDFNERNDIFVSIMNNGTYFGEYNETNNNWTFKKLAEERFAKFSVVHGNKYYFIHETYQYDESKAVFDGLSFKVFDPILNETTEILLPFGKTEVWVDLGVISGLVYLRVASGNFYLLDENNSLVVEENYIAGNSFAGLFPIYNSETPGSEKNKFLSYGWEGSTISYFEMQLGSTETKKIDLLSSTKRGWNFNYDGYGNIYASEFIRLNDSANNKLIYHDGFEWVEFDEMKDLAISSIGTKSEFIDGFLNTRIYAPVRSENYDQNGIMQAFPKNWTFYSKKGYLISWSTNIVQMELNNFVNSKDFVSYEALAEELQSSENQNKFINLTSRPDLVDSIVFEFENNTAKPYILEKNTGQKISLPEVTNLGVVIHGMQGWEIALIVISTITFILAGLGLAWILVKRRKPTNTSKVKQVKRNSR